MGEGSEEEEEEEEESPTRDSNVSINAPNSAILTNAFCRVERSRSSMRGVGRVESGTLRVGGGGEVVEEEEEEGEEEEEEEEDGEEEEVEEEEGES